VGGRANPVPKKEHTSMIEHDRYIMQRMRGCFNN
jgi:hypothetical protein